METGNRNGGSSKLVWMVIVGVVCPPLLLLFVPSYLNRQKLKQQAMEDWQSWSQELDTARGLADFPIALKAECVANVPEYSETRHAPQCLEIVSAIRTYAATRENEFLFADSQMQNFLYLKYGLNKQLQSSLRFVAGHIIAVDLEEGLKTIYTETQSQSVSTVRGGLGRAAVGGLVFGGSGAVVGAVTADRYISGSSTAIGHEQQGDVVLRISTVSPELPIITMRMNPATGRDWLARVQRLIAMRNIPAPQAQQHQQQFIRIQAG